MCTGRYKPTEAQPVPIAEFQPLKETAMDIGYYMHQIGAGAYFKAPLALVGSFYTSHLGGDWVLLLGFLALNVADLILGAWVALKTDCFSIIRLRKWVIKLLTYGTCIVVVGLLNIGFTRASGIAAPILDGFLLILMATESLSVFANMGKLGLPVPGVAVKLAQGIRDKSCEKMEEITEVKRSEPQN